MSCLLNYRNPLCQICIRGKERKVGFGPCQIYVERPVHQQTHNHLKTVGSIFITNSGNCEHQGAGILDDFTMVQPSEKLDSLIEADCMRAFSCNDSLWSRAGGIGVSIAAFHSCIHGDTLNDHTTYNCVHNIFGRSCAQWEYAKHW